MVGRREVRLAERALPAEPRARPSLWDRPPASGDGAGWEPEGSDWGGVLPVPTTKLTLWLFLATATMAFSMLGSAYLVRAALPDWRAIPKPAILGLNTGLLVLASLALQGATRAASAGSQSRLRWALATGGLLSAAFLLGQLVAWRLLSRAGIGMWGNPASGFFYLITALHGLHVMGGLVAWARTVRTAWTGRYTASDHLGLDLCALYWHFLLAVWLAMLALLWLA